MARDKHPEHGKISRIEGKTGKKGAADKIKEFYDQQLKRPTGRRPSDRAAEKPKADQFRRGSIVPKFLRSVQKRQESSWVYQSFKLPGTNYLVRDRRGGKAPDEAAKKDQGFEMKDGKLHSAKEKSYVNYLGDRQMLQPKVPKGAASEISRLLSEFEKLLVDRFEKGKKIAQESADGKPHFKLKTDAQWRSFFSKFLKRTVWKQGELSALKQFIFRGLVQMKRGGGAYAMLIGDMMMADGKMDKFARLKVLSDVAKLLANLEPGSTLEAEIIRKGLSVEEFKYLALAHKHGEKGVRTGAEPTRGMFGQLKTEEQVAEKLGLRRRKKGGAYGGPIKWGEKDEEEEKHAFVPWAWWDREERKGKPLLFKSILFTLIAALLFVLIMAIIKYL